MNSSRNDKIAIIGGGPAGSIAALCLKKLGRNVVLFEKETHPRYRVGESLLPGTASILDRLGLKNKLEAANFPKKRSATFIWNEKEPPLTFSFATPKLNNWTYDYAYQVNRSVFDKILLDEAAERGVDVRENCRVTGVRTCSNGRLAQVNWEDSHTTGSISTPWVIDASGSSGVVARSQGSRKYDAHFRHIAIWSYYRGGKRYGGDIDGSSISITINDGWIWLIPQSDDIYSVGVVTGIENSQRIKKFGIERFYQEALESNHVVKNILLSAQRCDKTRIVKDWSYESCMFSKDQVFLCGDSACFIDPLFSQGVHLAAYSARLAAAGIDRLMNNPEDRLQIQEWYNKSYTNAYDRYHLFLTTFYSMAGHENSEFWSKYSFDDQECHRFGGKSWYANLKQMAKQQSTSVSDQIASRARVIQELWSHTDQSLDSQFEVNELSLRRLKWVSDLVRSLHRMHAIRWSADKVILIPFFQVNAISFKLERISLIGDGAGRILHGVPLTKEHADFFETLRFSPLSFKEIKSRLKLIATGGNPVQIVSRLMDLGLLTGHDINGTLVPVPAVLRFGGVGADDDLS